MPIAGRTSSDESDLTLTDPATPRQASARSTRGPARSVTASSAILATGTVFARAAALLTAIVLARHFEPAAFAVILLAQAAAQYLAMVLDFGLTLGGIRLVARAPDVVRAAMGGVLLIRSILGLAGVVTVWAATLLLGFDPTTRTVFVFFAIATAASGLDLSWVAQAKQSPALRAVVLAGASGFAFVALVLVLPFVSHPVVAPVVQLAGLTTFVGIAAVVAVRRYGRPQVPRRNLLRIMVAGALPIGLATLLAQVYYNLDVLLLGMMRSLTEVAVYGAAYKIILGLLMLGWTYALATLPRFTLASSAGPDVLKAELGRRMRHLAAGMVPVLVGCAVLAEPLLVAVFGPTYAVGEAPFALLLASVLVSAFGSLILYALVAAGRNWAIPISNGSGAALNIVLNLALIPPFGMMGAAWATMASVLLVLVLAALQARSFLPRFGWGYALQLGMAGLLVAVVAGASRPLPLPVVALIGGVAYLTATIVLGFWRPNELATMKSLPARASRFIRNPRKG